MDIKRIANTGFMIEQIGEDAVVVNQDTLDSYLLNHMGLVLLNALQSPQTNTDLYRIITQEYDVDESVAQNDVDRFVNTLEEYQFIIHAKQ